MPHDDLFAKQTTCPGCGAPMVVAVITKTMRCAKCKPKVRRIKRAMVPDDVRLRTHRFIETRAGSLKRAAEMLQVNRVTLDAVVQIGGVLLDTTLEAFVKRLEELEAAPSTTALRRQGV